MPRMTQGQSIAEASMIAEVLERERCIWIARRIRAKWQRIVNSPKATVIGGACAAGSVRAADEIIEAIRGRNK